MKSKSAPRERGANKIALVVWGETLTKNTRSHEAKTKTGSVTAARKQRRSCGEAAAVSASHARAGKGNSSRHET